MEDNRLRGRTSLGGSTVFGALVAPTSGVAEEVRTVALRPRTSPAVPLSRERDRLTARYLECQLVVLQRYAVVQASHQHGLGWNRSPTMPGTTGPSGRPRRAPFEVIARQLLGHRDVAMVAKVHGRFKPDTEERNRWE